MYFTVGFEALHFYCVYTPEEKSEKILTFPKMWKNCNVR